MKKLTLMIAGIVLAGGFAVINAQTSVEPVPAASCESGYTDSKMIIQANYNEMYKALPQDLQDRIRSAATTIENLRMKPPLELQNYVATERTRAEEFMKTTISQLSLADMLKVQVDDARKEINVQINERMNELKARRAAHR
jgi:TolA-binding protein